MAVTVEKVPLPVPGGAAVERLAVGMAAAAGVVWHVAPPETRDLYRVAGNAALILMGFPDTASGAALGGARFAAIMAEAMICQRFAVQQIEGPGATENDEVWVKRLYRSAHALEMASRALEAVSATEAEEVV